MKLFKQINKVDKDIAEYKTAISNIRKWEPQTAADLRELDREKKSLEKAKTKKLELLARLEDYVQTERETLLTNENVAVA